MGHHTLVVIDHDFLTQLAKDQHFGEALVQAILTRRNGNVPVRTGIDTLYAQIGQTFYEKDSFLIPVKEGVVGRLSIEEQTYLADQLRKFRARTQNHEQEV
jgi:hypothetical protein